MHFLLSRSILCCARNCRLNFKLRDEHFIIQYIIEIYANEIDISFASAKRVSIDILHDQLPLAVPCYDLVLVIEFTLDPAQTQELRALPTPLT